VCKTNLNYNLNYVFRRHVIVKAKNISFHALKAYRGSRDIAPPIFTLGSKWRSVVKFTSRSLSPRLIYPVSIEIRVGGLQSSTLFEKRKSLVPAGFRTRGVQPIASLYSDCAVPTPVMLYMFTALLDVSVSCK